jgi:putative transposase
MKDRKRNRMQNFDYSKDAVYFITACCKNRIHHFGNIIEGKMNLNKYGEIARNQMEWLVEQYPYIILHNYAIMPNHIHILIEINRERAGFAVRAGATCPSDLPQSDLYGQVATCPNLFQ